MTDVQHHQLNFDILVPLISGTNGIACHVLNQHQLLFQLHKINHLVQLGMFQQLHYSTNKSKYKYKSSFKYKSSGNLQFIFLNVYN